MIPILYDQTGKCLGPLADCTRCYVTQETAGVYEAEIDYPMDGRLFGSITNGAYILAKPDDVSQPQKFIVYKPVKHLYGIATFHCEHLRYALNGVPVSRGRYTGSPAVVLRDMAQSVNGTSDFTFWSDISSVQDVDVSVPATVGKMLAGQTGSVLDIFGGDYEFDNYTVKLHSRRGQDRSTEIRYRKNLTGFTCETDTTGTYSHVYPFYYNEMENAYVELAQKTIALANASLLPFIKCCILDLSEEFDDTPTAAQLEAKARKFIQQNKPGEIKYSYRVSFIPLWQTEEYKNVAALERCGLYDTVPVIHEKAGTDIRVKIVRTVYDTLVERYVEMELGNAVNSFAQTVTQEINKVNESVRSTRSFMQVAISKATAEITGNHGGYVVLYDSNGDGEPDEILIMDTPSVLTATKVWRWNAGGLGYSDNGYAGPFRTAITMSGSIVADFVNTGNLNANVIRSGVLLADLIKAGVISDTTGNISINMTNGQLSMRVDSGQEITLNRGGLKLYDSNNNVVAGMSFLRDLDDNLKGSVHADYLKGGTVSADYISTDDLSVHNRMAIMKFSAVKTRQIDIEDAANNDSVVGQIGVNANGESLVDVDRLSAENAYIRNIDADALQVDGYYLRRRLININGTDYVIMCGDMNPPQ